MTETQRIEQQPTGIAGLDILLRGGLVEGGIYLVLGRPGTGKTTLGNHLAFNVVNSGGNALYVTVMAETHDRMLMHLSGFDFLHRDQVGDGIHYLSVYDEMLENGLDGVQSTLRRAIRERGYDLVIIDGASVLEMATSSHYEYRRFVTELGAHMSALGCTVILLALHSNIPEEHSITPYVDGILMLEDQRVGLQDIRYLHMIKVRGVEHIRGRHRFTISQRGFEVYPRLESVLIPPASDSGGRKERVSTGIAGLDEMLHGGLLESSSTLVFGPPGIGKTMLGLQFILEGARHGERSLMATFHESSQALELIADGVSEELKPLRQQGLVRIFSTTDPELPVDDWAWKLLEQIEEHKPQRVLVDGFSDVARLRLEPHRMTSFYRALTGTLTSYGITTMVTAESHEIFRPDIGTPQSEIATMSDNVILMHYVQVISHMHRILSAFKVRGASHDQSEHEFTISDKGIEINTERENGSRILTAARSADTDGKISTGPGGEFETAQ